MSAPVDAAVFALARLNPSGYISLRTLLPELGWTAGDRIAFTVEHGCIR